MAQVFTKKLIEVNGIAQITANVQKLLVRLTEEGSTLQECRHVFMTRGGIPLREYARSIAPVGKPHKRKGKIVGGGTFQASIFAAFGPSHFPSILFGANHRKAPHAHLVEYGSSRMKGYHTLRKAIVAKRGQVVADIATGLKEVIVHAAEKP